MILFNTESYNFFNYQLGNNWSYITVITYLTIVEWQMDTKFQREIMD